MITQGIWMTITLLILPWSCESVSSIVDLSYTFTKNTPNHPQLARFELRVAKRGLNKFGNWMELNDFFTSEHSGTHLDAPAHYLKDGITVDEISNYKLYRVPGVMIDVREKIRNNVNYEIRAQDIEEWTDNNGRLPDGGVVLFQTGWGEKSERPLAYSGIDQFGQLHFPGLGRDAAEYLVRYGNRTGQRQGVVGVGIDTLSMDMGQGIRMPAHIILLGSGIFGLENVANLNQLPERGFTLTMLPVKIGTGSGAPVRIIAEMDGEPYASPLGSSSVSTEPKSILASLSLIFILVWSRRAF